MKKFFTFILAATLGISTIFPVNVVLADEVTDIPVIEETESLQEYQTEETETVLETDTIETEMETESLEETESIEVSDLEEDVVFEAASETEIETASESFLEEKESNIEESETVVESIPETITQEDSDDEDVLLAAGNTMSTATSISLGSTYSGSITSSNTVDYYKFTLSSSGSIKLTATAYLEYIYYRVYDSSGNRVWNTSPSWNSTTRQISTSETVHLTKGTYYFVAEQSYSRTGSYNFKIAFTSAGESFTETGSGTNNSINTASAISVNSQYKAQIAANDTVDFYKFTLSSSGRINLVATAYMQYLYYRIYDSSGNQLWRISPSWNSTTEQIATKEYIDLTKGTYYFVAEQSYERTGNFSFKLSFTSAGESFTETESGTNNSLNTANTVSINTTYKGQIAANDTVDFYKFTMSSAGKAILVSSANLEYVYYRLYDSAGNQLWSDSFYWNYTSEKLNVEEEFYLSKGTYYLAVEDYGYGEHTGNYTIKIARLTAPVLSSVSNVYGGVKITWKAVNYAEKYRVYRKTGSGSWTAVGDTSSTAFTDKTAKSGTKYTYTVRCITEDGENASGYNTTGKTITYIAPPIIKSIQNNNVGVKLIWGKITGAPKYRVFRKTGSGSWVKIGDTSSTAYTDKTAKNGTKYTYTIRCINSDGTKYVSDFNKNGKTIVYVSRPTLSSLTSPSTNQITGKWTKNASAAGYYVQYSTSSTFSSNKASIQVEGAANITKAIRGLTSGKTYYVRVRAYKRVSGTTYYSSWSDKKSVKVK